MADVTGTTTFIGNLQINQTANGPGAVGNCGSLKNIMFAVWGFTTASAVGGIPARATVYFEGMNRDGDQNLVTAPWLPITVVPLGKNPPISSPGDTVVQAATTDGLYWFNNPGPIQQVRARIGDYVQGTINVSASGNAT